MNNNKFELLTIGMEAKITHKITEKDVSTFVDLTGDNNPLHVDRKFASKTTFKQPVVHGMLTASFISTIIGTKLPGPGALWYEQKIKFINPVRIGTRITVIAKVVHKSLSQKIIILDTKIFDDKNKPLIEGEAKVKILVDGKSDIIPKNDISQESKIFAKKIKQGNDKDKAIIITGSSRGIGHSIAKDLALNGYPVVVNYLNNNIVAEDLVAEIKKIGGKAIAVKGDVSNKYDIENLVEKTFSEYDNIYGIVNNASGSIEMKDYIDFEWEDIEKQFNTQLKGSFNLTQAVLSHFLDMEEGVIVNIASTVVDSIPPAKWLPYNMAKAALVAETKTLANEYGPKGIRVNCVSPGMTQTDLIADIPEKAKIISRMQTPLRRLTEPQDIANIVTFLFSSKANFITGQNIRVSGGSIM